MAVRISKRVVDAASVDGNARMVLHDNEISGFALRVTAKGAKSYVLRYRRNGRSRWFTIGSAGDLTPDQARKEATRLRGEIAVGGDPAAQRAILRGVPTVREFAKRNLDEYAKPSKKPRSYDEDARNLETHILPKLGSLKVTEVGTADVQRLHHAMRSIPTTANRCRALISTMMNLAERWELRPRGSNPATFVEKYEEKKRDRLVTASELKRIGAALRVAAKREAPAAIACIRLLILTGCRLGEIQTLQWDHVDLARACLRLPDSKTGAKLVPLGAPAVELLSKIPRLGDNPYVLPGLKRGAHFVGVEKFWDRIRKRARVPDLRIHDLRHAFASTGASQGESLVILGRLLGHTSPLMTARYAHLAPDPARAAADRIAAEQARALDGKSGPLQLAFERLGKRSLGSEKGKRAGKASVDRSARVRSHDLGPDPV